MAEVIAGTLPPSSRRTSSWVALFFLTAAAGLLFFCDPVQHRFYPVCWFHKLTGLDCPGCGGLRASHALLHGRWWEAFHDNALLVILLPVAGIYFVRSALGRGKQLSSTSPRRTLWPWIWLAVLMLFGVLRNLPYPAFAWMSP